MQARGRFHGLRHPALLGGVVAVAALVLFAVPPPAQAGSATEFREPPSSPSASGGCPAAPEQALHRVHVGTAGTPARLAHPVGCLPGPVQPAAARCDGRPCDAFRVAPPSSGPPLRILFCTWLN